MSRPTFVENEDRIAKERAARESGGPKWYQGGNAREGQ
jgi:hypothetical protein